MRRARARRSRVCGPWGPRRVAVTSLLNELVAAWGRHDVEAYSQLFTADATYTTFIGTLSQGRQDMVDSHRSLFTGFLNREPSPRTKFSTSASSGRMSPSSTDAATPTKASGPRASGGLGGNNPPGSFSVSSCCWAPTCLIRHRVNVEDGPQFVHPPPCRLAFPARPPSGVRDATPLPNVR
ncbi:SgcJ/EcaC family oxidoreductase [Streptomyces natalensis]|uniref:SgcJ/EcaC family oxidoreductase n=1 Tax=Streptomyces natalensis TaxID=68242 RepID=UPI001F52A8F1|nr:SgcJ/EcaC family oxidoreductase [Streptomyces natalensis]